MTGLVKTFAALLTEIDSVLASGQAAASITPVRLRQLVEDIEASLSPPEATLTYASSLTWDLDAKPVAVVTLTGNVTISPLNGEIGRPYRLAVVQDATGSRTVTIADATVLGIASWATAANGANLLTIDYTGLPAAITLDTASSGANLTFSNGNLTVTKNTSGGNTVSKALNPFLNGKYYYEGTATTVGDLNFGVANPSQSLADWLGSAGKGGIAWSSDGTVYCNDVLLGTINTYATGNQIAVAVDLNNRLFWGRVAAGNWNNSGPANPATGTGGLSFAAANAGPWTIAVKVNGVGDAATINPGPSFAQTIPAGFTAWPTGRRLAQVS